MIVLPGGQKTLLHHCFPFVSHLTLIQLGLFLSPIYVHYPQSKLPDCNARQIPLLIGLATSYFLIN